MRLVIFIGAPGAGKGSVSQTLVSEYGFKHVSTGELLRHKLKDQKDTEKGNLVNDDYVNQMLIEHLKTFKEDDVVILDGYPRTSVQANFLAQHHSVEVVFLLTHISDEQIIKRLSSRVLCRANGHSFNLLLHTPKVAGICDFDGSELYRRPDDEGEIIKKRLSIYREHTQPLIDYYRKESALVEIDAKQDMHKMAKEVYNFLKKKS